MFYSIFINSCNMGYVSLSCVKLRPIIIIIIIIIIIKEDNKTLSLISLTRLFNVILRWSKAVLNENMPFTYWKILVGPYAY